MTSLGASRDASRAAPTGGRPLRAGTGRRTLRLLLAEDNPVNQRLAVRLLEKQGHQVVVAGNGREALAALDGQPFDVVLMDVQMPEMDGFEATAAIRAREPAPAPHIPIIAMTAHAMKGDRERCLEAGMDGYVSKPIRPQELFEVLEGLVTADDRPSPPRRTAGGPARRLRPGRGPGRVDGDAELLKELAGLFLGECPQRMAEIRQAIDQRDASRLHQAAHTLGGPWPTSGPGRPSRRRSDWRRTAASRTGVESRQHWAALEEAIGRLEPAFVELGQARECRSGGMPAGRPSIVSRGRS